MNDERPPLEADSAPAEHIMEQDADGQAKLESATPAEVLAENMTPTPSTDSVGRAGPVSEGPSSLEEGANPIDDESPSPSAEAGESTVVEEAVDELADDDVDDEDGPEEVKQPSRAVPTGPVELNLEEEEVIKHDWYILKVQSNRETSIVKALQRKVAIEGLDDYFDEILVPMEKVTEFKGGKKKIVKRKIWPGYIAVRMHVNDDTWFALRETSGIGDFTGSGGKPSPMPPEEIKKIKPPEDEEVEETPKLDIKFRMGDKVKVMEGNFENFEGEVSGIDETHGRVTVMLSIFGRPTPVELEYWQVEVV